ESRALEEERAANGRTVLHLHGFDVAGLAVLPDVDDLTLSPDDAAPLGIAAKVGGGGRSVELERVVAVGLRPAWPLRAASDLAEPGRLRFRTEPKLVGIP